MIWTSLVNTSYKQNKSYIIKKIPDLSNVKHDLICSEFLIAMLKKHDFL